ncbi:MAG: hypothetical protein E7K47_09885 [Acidovorax sp.]|nr:hypothetical protein [Acidovorax sp.]
MTDSMPVPPSLPADGVVPLSHLGVIRVAGEDAAKFLHGQLTQDFALLDLHHARLAAFLTVKGRMQASFIAFKRSETEVLLVCARDLLAPALKRRTYLAHAPSAVAVGAEVFADGDAEQPVGTVVQVAAAPTGGVDALVSLQIAATSGALQVGAAEGVALTLLPLPYALLEDI